MKTQIGLLLGILAAGIAVHTQQPFAAGVPSSAVVFFDGTTATGCSNGWAEVTAARGFYLTALVASGTRATAVGTALTDQEDRTHTHSMTHTHTISHTHTYSGTTSAPSLAMSKRGLAVSTASTGTHTHTFSGTTSDSSSASSGASSAANTGVQSTTILPHLQYLVCKRN